MLRSSSRSGAPLLTCLLLIGVVTGCAGPGFDDAGLDAGDEELDAGVGDAGDGDGDAGSLEDGGDDGGVDDGGVVVEPADPTCTLDGCVRTIEDWGDYTVADLRPFVPVSIPLDNGYRVRRIVFFTDGREARAVVTLPFDTDIPDDGFHVAINNPGTVGLGDPCAAGNGVYGSGLAGLYGARGLIGAAVDYPGLGTGGPHPYLVKSVEGRASLDAVRATLQLAALLDVPTSGRAVVTGLSQGGHATLAAAELHEDWAPELDIVAFAVAGPASVWLEHWQGGLYLNGPHHVYTAMLTWAWSEHYDVDRSELFTPAAEMTFELAFEEQCLAGTEPTLFDTVPTDPATLFTTAYQGAWQAGDVSDWPALSAAWEENRVGGWGSPANDLLVMQGSADDVVLPQQTSDLVDALEASGVNVDYRVIAGGGHVDVAFNALAVEQLAQEDALAWLNQKLDE